MRTTDLTKEEILQIPELVKSKTYPQIATHFDVSVGTIKNWILKLRESGYHIKVKKGRRGILSDVTNENQ